MNDVFDEDVDDLNIARNDVKILESLRFTDGFRDGLESIEQEAFENGFLRSYGILSKLVFDFYLDKEYFLLKNDENMLSNEKFIEFEKDLKSTVDQVKTEKNFDENIFHEEITKLEDRWKSLKKISF